jgi:hypothetical protein
MAHNLKVAWHFLVVLSDLRKIATTDRETSFHKSTAVGWKVLVRCEFFDHKLRSRYEFFVAILI